MFLIICGKVVGGMGEYNRFSRKPLEKTSAIGERRKRPPEKFHPLLQRWIAERPADDTDLFMINFRDDLILPRFPEPAADQSSDSPAHQEAMRRSKELVQQIKNRRAGNYEELKQELTNKYRAEVLETFWLINAVLVQMTLGSVVELAQREDVQYIEPRFSGEEPPQVGNPPPYDANPDNDVQDGRALLGTDSYFNLGLTDGRIGLLDTGVRFTHILFNSLNIGFRGDCVNGGENCDAAGTGFNPDDDCWNHGTSSAAIIMADASQIADPNQRDAFRGVTGIILDSYKVYPTSFADGRCSGRLDVRAAVWGFETAVARLDKVIVAEIQSDASDLGAISSAADDAFDTGAVIIAANGNGGPDPYTVNAPASAHKVIGVGEIDVIYTKEPIFRQSRGPAPDGRHKPDIQAPSWTETASSVSDTAFRIHMGTSGSTPYAAGAAALLRNWLQQQLLQNNPPIAPGQLPAIDPGHVYAQLILAGQQSFPFDDIRGAGPLRLVADGGIAWGKVSVDHDETIDIPLNVRVASPDALDGALWWPERAALPSSATAEIHNDIDLYLIDPNGDAKGESTDDDSVFERACVAGPIMAGVWNLRIQGCDVPGGTQTVYWAARGPFDSFVDDA